MSIVQLRVESIFGGEERRKNTHGTELYKPVVAFVIPEEPSERVRSLISYDEDGTANIYASVGTTDRAKTVALFNDLASDGREFDFDISAPGHGPNCESGCRKEHKTGYLKNYVGKPGQAGFDLPPDVVRTAVPTEGSPGAAGGGASTVVDHGRQTGNPAPISLLTAITEAVQEWFSGAGAQLNSPGEGASETDAREPAPVPETDPELEGMWELAENEFGTKPGDRVPIILSLREMRGGPVDPAKITSEDLADVIRYRRGDNLL